MRVLSHLTEKIGLFVAGFPFGAFLFATLAQVFWGTAGSGGGSPGGPGDLVGCIAGVGWGLGVWSILRMDAFGGHRVLLGPNLKYTATNMCCLYD